VLEWTAPRRFDLVHMALDHVPPARRRESLERCLRELVNETGRLVLRPEPVDASAPDLAESVRGLGLPVGGVLESRHPSTGAVCRSVWLCRGP
jgi:hypothetical protein